MSRTHLRTAPFQTKINPSFMLHFVLWLACLIDSSTAIKVGKNHTKCGRREFHSWLRCLRNPSRALWWLRRCALARSQIPPATQATYMLTNIGVKEKRSWERLGTSERSSKLWPQVKNMASRTYKERHTGSFFLEPKALLWEINAMKLPALMDEPNFCRA